MCIVSRKQLKAENEALKQIINEYEVQYPFLMGQVVYDVQLRNNKGRFTTKNPSKEYSMINEVTVDKKNYFNLVDRYNNNDVFFTEEAAKEYIDTVCVE